MTSGAPRVSAMVLVRNRPDLVRAAVASVLAQEGPPLEVVLVDDASTDDTPAVVAALAAADPRIVVHTNTEQLGIPASRNVALGLARGAYVAICDSDDLSRPGRFRDQVAALDADPTLVGVGGAISRFTDVPGADDVPRWNWGLRDGRLPFAFPSGTFRTAALREVGGFDESFPAAEDLDLCFRLAARRGRFAALPQVVLDYRVHDSGVTAQAPFRHQWHTLRAQVRGAARRGVSMSPRGYAVIAQSALRTLLALPRR